MIPSLNSPLPGVEILLPLPGRKGAGVRVS